MSRRHVLTDVSRWRSEGKSGVQEYVEGSHHTKRKTFKGGARVCVLEAAGMPRAMLLSDFMKWHYANQFQFFTSQNANSLVAECSCTVSQAKKGSLTVRLSAVVQGTKGIAAATP